MLYQDKLMSPTGSTDLNYNSYNRTRMGGKKKGGDKPKKAAAGAEDDINYLDIFWSAYRKEVAKYE